MAAVRCTAPAWGHVPGSQAQRECPVHGRQASREVLLPVAVVAPVSSDEPTVVERYSDGTVEREEWLVGGRRHRTDGPARVWYRPDGTIGIEEWWAGGKLHRTDGPARVWYRPDGTIDMETWYLDGELHREGGPAWVERRPDGTVEPWAWYLDGTRVEPWEALGRHLLRQGTPELSAEALKQIVRDVPWQRWSELGPDHPLVALWAAVHPRADISAG